MTTEKSTNVRKPMAGLRRLMTGVAQLSPDLAASLGEHVFLRAPKRRPIAPSEQAVMHRARRRVLSWRGERIHTYRWGGPLRFSPGGVVLLVHGWGGNAAQMTPLVDPLLEAGFGVIGLDLVGHGASSGRSASLLDFADLIELVGGRTGRLAAIVSHSAGGAGTAMALSRGVDAERAVLIAPPSDAQVWFEQFADFFELSDRVKRKTRARIERRVGLPFEELNIISMGPKVAQPVLIVHDTQDREVPLSAGQAVAQHARHAVLEVTRGLGHRRILRDAEVLHKVVGFVGRRASPEELIDRELFEPWRRALR